MLNRIRLWLARHPHWTLTCLVFAALAPFLAKPFNIDDPLFIWAGKQIQAHPANPYGFDVNWYGSVDPLWNVMENPPLACYFVALAALIFGWGEIGLHLAFVLPAIAAILGTHRLAKRLCPQPVLAALLTLFTPVFLVSANTVMCDVMLLAFWVWAIVFWLEGLAGEEERQLLISGGLMALAVLCKYFGLCLIPLLAAHGLAHHRRAGRWMFGLLIPVATLLAYEFATLALYGEALFSSAAGYTAVSKGLGSFSAVSTGLVGLAFTGGCAATAVFFMPLVWRPRTLFAFTGATVLFAGTLFWGETLTLLAKDAKPFAVIQIVFWAAGGLAALTLAATEYRQRRTPETLLLLLWTFGTFIFASFINWTVNGRSLLPMMPALAILLVRRLDQRTHSPGRVSSLLVVSAVFALLVAWSDYRFAQAVRHSAEQTSAQRGPSKPTLWFQGHWGYQFYLESPGAVALDLANSPLQVGDLLAVPLNNTNLRPPQQNAVALLTRLTVPKGTFLTTMDETLGASFYASVKGPLPFVFGKTPADQVLIFRFTTLPPAPPLTP